MRDIGLCAAGASAMFVLSAMLVATTHGLTHKYVLRFWSAALVGAAVAVVVLTTT